MPLAYIIWLEGGPPGAPTHPIAPGGGAPVDPGYGISIERPTHPIAPGGPPPIIWPSPGHPANPIVLPPVLPGGPPLVIWGPNDPRPSNPIVLPPAPPDTDNEGIKPPPPEGGWGYSPRLGWGYFPKPGEPGPK